MLRKARYALVLLGLLAVLLAACQTTGETDVTPLPPTATTEPTPEAPTAEPTSAATPTAEPTATAEPAATTEAPAASLDEFINQLQLAIAARDFTAMQTFMTDPFAVGYWLSEGVSLTPAEAAAQFESNFLPEGAQITWADPAMDLAPLLQGQPPATFLGPDKQVVATLLSYGWGPDGAGEAIQFITQQPDGTYRWELMLYSGFGFAAE